MRAYRWLVALVFMAGGLHAQTVGSLASSACPLGGCAQGGTGTVTTTSTLVSGRVALSSGASSLTDDAGCTWTGTGASFVGTFSGVRVGAGALGVGVAAPSTPLSVVGAVRITDVEANETSYFGSLVYSSGGNTALNMWNRFSGSLVSAINLGFGSVPGTDTTLSVQLGRVVAYAPVTLKGYTVATLPTGTQGDTAYVTDATAPTYLGALTGGGAVVTPVFHNGSAWVSH